VAPVSAAQGLAVVPEAAWSRPVDADLLRFGLLQPHALHPLVGAALSADAVESGRAVTDVDASPYHTVPGIESVGAYTPGSVAIRVHCGSEPHRIAWIDGSWQAVDHDERPTRETLLVRLGGHPNVCRGAVEYLSTGRHVVDLLEPLLEHGRIDDAMRLLREQAGFSAAVAPESVGLPDGSTVGEALDALRENTLRMRMYLSGALPTRDTRSARLPRPRRRRARKGDPARLHR
ncbi:MAG: hypothetical protein ACRDSS_13000, partial [Actinocrinis sp.]